MVKQVSLAIAACVASVALSQTALAEETDLAKAKEHFSRGQELFQQEKFVESAEAFITASSHKPFAAFYYNAALSFENGKDYTSAVKNYKLYLEKRPNAKDRGKVERRIEVFEKLLAATAAADAAAQKAQQQQVASLGAGFLRGVILIDSDPEDAEVFLDDPNGVPIGRTPHTIEDLAAVEGTHEVYVRLDNYKPAKLSLTVDLKNPRTQFQQLKFALTELGTFGILDVRANVTGAQVYINQRNKEGLRGKVPFRDSFNKGEYEVWVVKEGYGEFSTKVTIEPGKTAEVVAKLVGSDPGYLNIRGTDVQGVRVFVDGVKICDGACRKTIEPGTHTVTMQRKGDKPLTQVITVESNTEVTLRPKMAQIPSRADAIKMYVTSGVFLGVGIYMGIKAKGLDDDVAAGTDGSSLPPTDNNDPRLGWTYGRGGAANFGLGVKGLSVGANTAMGLGVVTLGLGLYYQFRDKGPPSTARVDTRSVAVTPHVAPGYSGMGMEVRW